MSASWQALYRQCFFIVKIQSQIPLLEKPAQTKTQHMLVLLVIGHQQA